MGKKLLEYYKKAEEIGGKKAQLKLELATCMPLIFVRILEDSPENIEVFKLALKKITDPENLK